jgi:hypothetical protein
MKLRRLCAGTPLVGASLLGACAEDSERGGAFGGSGGDASKGGAGGATTASGSTSGIGGTTAAGGLARTGGTTGNAGTTGTGGAGGAGTSKTHMCTQGSDLFAHCGEKVLLRGVNQMSIWTDASGSSYPAIASFGSNVIRIVFTVSGTAAGLDALLTKAEENKMIPMPEIRDATGAQARHLLRRRRRDLVEAARRRRVGDFRAQSQRAPAEAAARLEAGEGRGYAARAGSEARHDDLHDPRSVEQAAPGHDPASAKRRGAEPRRADGAAREAANGGALAILGRSALADPA